MQERDNFEWLLEQEIPHLRRYALSLTSDPSEADDLVQDCLERALQKWRRWQAQGRLRSWLFRMLFRVHLNRRRGQKHERAHQSLDDLTVEPAQAAQQQSRAECFDIIRAMEQLPEDQKQAIVLVALEDMNYGEAAWVLRIPVGTLRSRISRGRSVLRAMCGEQMLEAPQRTALRRVK